MHLEMKDILWWLAIVSLLVEIAFRLADIWEHGLL